MMYGQTNIKYKESFADATILHKIFVSFITQLVKSDPKTTARTCVMERQNTQRICGISGTTFILMNCSCKRYAFKIIYIYPQCDFYFNTNDSGP